MGHLGLLFCKALAGLSILKRIHACAGVPIPEEHAAAGAKVEQATQQALDEAQQKGLQVISRPLLCFQCVLTCGRPYAMTQRRYQSAQMMLVFEPSMLQSTLFGCGYVLQIS